MVVYQHRRLDTNEIFYIGIGKSEKRAYTKHKRNHHWTNIVNKYGYSVEIVTTCKSWEEACQIEQYLIKFYGRRDLGLGNLVNMTDGGDGTINPSEETLLKISESKKGKPSPHKGIKYSEERAFKCSSLFRKDILILDTSNGIYYSTIKEASEAIGVKRTTLNAMLKGQNPNKTNLKYV